jgi:hypothetical protein
MGLRPLWILLAGLACTSACLAEDIVDVLRRSQDLRLHAQPLAAADSPRAALVRRSFQTVLDGLRGTAPVVELRVVTGPLVAETLHGHIILANENLADMPETARLFILAHELGHVGMQHWQRVAMLYQKWIPGPVTPEHTDPVAAPLGREASAQAHEHEFAADAYAGRLLQRLGRPDSELLSLFRFLDLTHDTATHPGTRKRLAWLRAGLAGNREVAVGD